MPLFKVEVTRIVKSSKPFVVKADDDKSAEAEAIAAACEEEKIEQGEGGWIEDLEWQAEALYHEPRIGDTVRYSMPKRGEEHFRFRVLEITARTRKRAKIELICPFTTKPVDDVDIDQICLAEMED